MSRTKLRAELLHVIEGAGVQLPADFDDDASLIRSGLLDSTALFDVVLWVESRVPSGLDMTTFDLAEEWDTVAKVVMFVERCLRALA